MTGRLRQVGFRAAGAAALIPSFASFRIWLIQPLIQSNFKRDMPQPLRLILTQNAEDSF